VARQSSFDRLLSATPFSSAFRLSVPIGGMPCHGPRFAHALLVSPSAHVVLFQCHAKLPQHRPEDADAPATLSALVEEHAEH
jgi:hypothetical protein